MWSFAKGLCDWPCSFLVCKGSKVLVLQMMGLWLSNLRDFFVPKMISNVGCDVRRVGDGQEIDRKIVACRCVVCFIAAIGEAVLLAICSGTAESVG